jgi:dienelactone hydrolase
VATFVDTTGRPGPATWIAGTFPDGQGQYPVAGVSWYEAVAYCESVGKTLPTVYHWGSAASILALDSIIPVSNFSHKGLIPADDNRSLSVRGAYNMAGNVREWAWNAAREGRYILGGGWDDADYRFYEPEARPPLDRASANGFRCAKYIEAEALPDAVRQPMLLAHRDYSREKPVSDEVFNAYKSLYAYDKAELNAVAETVGETARWRKEKVTFSTAYDGGQRMTAYLYLPKNGNPPYQTVVYFPGAFGLGRTSSISLEPEESWWSFLPASGRAFMFPIFDGTYERNRRELRSSAMREDRSYRNYAIRWVQDFMRSIDYLETRSDIDSTKVACLAASWGGLFTPTLLAVDPRISTAVMPLAGLPMSRGLPEVDPLNFVRHARVPLLLMGAEFDSLFPTEASQRPLFDMWGAPADKKRYVVMKGIGHELFRAQNELIREILPWLDTHLGPVN